MENRGSEWKKWDLHLHSIYNNIKGCGDYNGISDEQFIEKIKKEDIKVVGLTNYINFSNKDFELAKKLRDKGIVVFYNLELRLTNLNDEEQLSDYHIIFSDELSPQNIKDVLANIIVKVGHTEKTANSITDKNDFQRAAVDFEELHKVLSSESLHINGKYLTGFLSRGHGNSICGRSRAYTVYEDIVRKSDIIIHSSDFIENLKIDKDFWSGKNDKNKEYIKPLIQTSDAHNLDQIGLKKVLIDTKYQNKENVYEKNGKYYIDVAGYTWIKSDLTFEGLKQIIYEPDERIKYEKNSPDDKDDYLIIDYLEYDDKKIFFNSGLNTIIGGRSTGKSTLLNSIAKYQNNLNSKKDHYTLPNVKVMWRDGQLDTTREVEFIPQEFMINISKNSEDLNNLLHKIIKEKHMDKEENKYKENISKIRENINKYLNEYFSKIDSISEISKPEGDREGITKSIKELNNKINLIRLNNQFDEKENSLYQEKCLELTNLQEMLQKNESERKNLLILKDNSLTVNINLENISDENKKLLNIKLSAIISQLNDEWEHSINEIINEVNHNITNLKNNINTVEASEIYIKGNELKDKNTELSELETKLSLEKQKLNVIENYEQKIMNLKEQIKHYSINIVKEFIKYKDEISLLEKTFNINENELSIKINPVLTDFSKKIDYLNARNKNSNDFVEKFKNIMINNNNEGMKKELLEIFNNNDLVFNRNKTLKDFINDIFSSNWFTYDYIITDQKDEFKNMSQGKKSFVILKLLLEFSDNKKPVLIDQPEDSLDNRAIYHELRNYILKTKKQRQVIIVTHNANVVVGADAENIIIANQHNEKEKNRDSVKFQYVNGSLENTKPKDEKCEYILESQGIREHIFDILEGGTEAFVKREQKYNVNNSLKNKYKM